MERYGAYLPAVARHRAAEAIEAAVQRALVPPVVDVDPGPLNIDDRADVFETATERELLLLADIDDVRLIDVVDAKWARCLPPA